MPWEQLVLTLGPITIAWGPATSILISLLKRWVGLTGAGITYATWIIGGLGLFLQQYLTGVSLWQAIGNALVAILTTKGFYEVVSKPLGKSLNRG